MSSSTNVNRMLLVAVIVLAVALAAVLIYFLAFKTTPTQKTPSSQGSSSSSSQTSASSQLSLATTAFERGGVENWLSIECIYSNYGENATLNAVNNIYTIAYNYIYDYKETNNVTYLLLYPIAQYQYIESNYAKCAINESDQA